MNAERAYRIDRAKQKVRAVLTEYTPLWSGERKILRSVNSIDTLVRKGRRIVRKLDAGSRQAVILQHKLLQDLLRENRDTEFGRKYGFADIHTAKEYKQRVPLSHYDDYEPSIRRMMKGEKNVLCAREPEYFALSSGSVGVPKYIPVSRAELEKFTNYSAEMAFGVADEYYRNTTGRGVPAGPGLNAIEMRVMPTESGVKQGAISGTLMASMKGFVPFLLTSPWEVVSPGEEMDMKYIKSRLALAERSLVFMDAAFMTGLVDLMDYIRDNYEMLCKDIWHGRINKDVKVPDAVREKLAPLLVPDRARAVQLLREFREGFETPIIPRIWPRMSWIGGIGTGGFYPYARRMRRYSGKSIPFNNLCYAASESLIAAARHMGDESYVLIPDGGFYEFIPADAEDEDGEITTLGIDELEVGEDYEVVLTNLSGFYRYRIGDVVRVTGYYNETPLIKFIYRKSQLISIAGEKTNEEAVRWAVDQFYLETKIHVSDYSVYADVSTSPGHYIILVEPERIVPEEQIAYCRDVLEEKLSRANPSFGDKVRTGVLGKTELIFLEQQTYQLYRDLMIMKGASPNQLKPVRVIDTPEKERFFFSRREKYED